jgi:hypothetical protein
MRRSIKVALSGIYDGTGTLPVPSVVAVDAVAVGAGLSMLGGPRR